VRADGRVSPFEFAVFHVVHRALDASDPDRTEERIRKNVPLAKVVGEAETVLSAIARAGAADDAGAQQAFDAGVVSLFGAQVRSRPVHHSGAVQLDRVDEALGRLARLRANDLRRLLDAAVETVQSDRIVSTDEVEMLRAVAEALEAPMPPVVPEDPGDAA
jgi:hypothetical protein